MAGGLVPADFFGALPDEDFLVVAPFLDGEAALVADAPDGEGVVVGLADGAGFACACEYAGTSAEGLALAAAWTAAGMDWLFCCAPVM